MKFYPPHYLLALSLCMLATWFFGETSPQTLPFILVGLSLIGFGFLLAFNSISRFIKGNSKIYAIDSFGFHAAEIKENVSKYDLNVDQRGFKWSGEKNLRKVEISEMPEYLSNNYQKYLDWIEI